MSSPPLPHPPAGPCAAKKHRLRKLQGSERGLFETFFKRFTPLWFVNVPRRRRSRSSRSSDPSVPSSLVWGLCGLAFTSLPHELATPRKGWMSAPSRGATAFAVNVKQSGRHANGCQEIFAIENKNDRFSDLMFLNNNKLTVFSIASILDIKGGGFYGRIAISNRRRIL